MIERLRGALGPDAVRLVPTDESSFAGPAPQAVVAPADIGQAVAALRICAEKGWTALPAGGATWLQSVRHRRADVLLSASRMVGVTEYEPADLAIAVRAGTTLADLDAETGSHDQFFPIQAPAAPAATVGGAVATASAGPLRLGYGTPRDHVLGLQVVTGDGRPLDLGGRVVKNVAGYDLVRLLVGSRGTLGLITRATLRLRSRPAGDLTAVIRAPDSRPLHEAITAITDTWPVAAELLAPLTARQLLEEHSASDDADWALALRWHGNETFAEHVTRRLDAIGPHRLLTQSEANRFWTSLSGLESDQAAAFHLMGLPGDLPVLVGAAESFVNGGILQSDNNVGAAAPSSPWHLAAHAGSGVVRVWTVAREWGAGGDPVEAMHTVQQAVTGLVSVRMVVPPAGGMESRAAPPDPGARSDSASGGPRVEALTRGIQRTFDPGGVLASGATEGPE